MSLSRERQSERAQNPTRNHETLRRRGDTLRLGSRILSRESDIVRRESEILLRRESPDLESVLRDRQALRRDHESVLRECKTLLRENATVLGNINTNNINSTSLRNALTRLYEAVLNIHEPITRQINNNISAIRRHEDELRAHHESTSDRWHRRNNVVNNVNDANSVVAKMPTAMAIDHDACSVCFEVLQDDGTAKQVLCGHVYHQKCIAEWLSRSKSSCPICRCTIT